MNDRHEWLRKEIRTRRVAKGMSQKDLGDHLGCSQGNVQKIEAGHIRPRVTSVREFVRLFEVEEPTAADMVTAAEELFAPGSRPKGLPVERSEAYRHLRASEADAAQVLCLHGERFPGPLQSRRYMTTLFGLDGRGMVEERVRARQERVDLLRSATARRYRAVLSESAFRRLPGGGADAVARAQFEHLRDLADLGHVELQVLPFTAPIPYLDPDFTVVAFADPADDYAYEESVFDSRTIRRPVKVRGHVDRWRVLSAAALSVADTRDFLKDEIALLR